MVALAGALVAATVTLPAPPAHAASPTSVADLQTLLTYDGFATLNADIIEPGTQLYVPRTSWINLNGFDLTTNSTQIAGGQTLSVLGTGTWTSVTAISQSAGIWIQGASLIVDGPDVIATGGEYRPGIGGYDGGSVTLNSGSITATGGTYAAGIGGGNNYGDGGTTIINGGTVVAQGGSWGAGIGSGNTNGYPGTTIVNGGTVTATGGYLGAGIGGGTYYRQGGSLYIGPAGSVTASGQGTAYAVTGPILVDGILTIPTGENLGSLVNVPMTVGPTGTITGGGVIGGYQGVLTNNGIITNTSVMDALEAGGNVTITNHNYKVSFDANYPGAAPVTPVRVYATTFADGNRTLPTPTRPGFFGTSWNTAADGSGATVTSTTTLTANTQLYAQWALPGFSMSPTAATVTAGGSQQFLAGSLVNFGVSDETDDFTFTTDVASDTIGASGLLGFTEAGDHTVTATYNLDNSVVLESIVTILGAAPADLELTASDLTVDQGGSVALTVVITDQFGNTLPATGVVITSDHPTDQIVGTNVTFPSASPHILTATLGALSASLLVTVNPAALAATGVDTSVPLGGAAALLLLGGAFLLRRRLRFR
jgi:hypothetical protein